MNTRALPFLMILLGLGSSLAGAAGCGPTCPASQPNCGTSNSSAGGASGAAGTASSSTCAHLTSLKSCMDAFCAATTNPFCNCYTKGFDLSTASCLCVTFDPQKFCDDQASSGAAYDCSSATGAVGTACVGVQ